MKKEKKHDRKYIKTYNGQPFIEITSPYDFMRTNMRDEDIAHAIHVWFKVNGDLQEFYNWYDGRIFHKRENFYSTTLRNYMRLEPMEKIRQFADTFEVFKKKFREYDKLRMKPLVLFWFRCGMYHPDGIIPWKEWKGEWLDAGYIPKRVGHNMKMIHKKRLTTDLEFYDFEDDRVVLWKGENYESRGHKCDNNQEDNS